MVHARIVPDRRGKPAAKHVDFIDGNRQWWHDNQGIQNGLVKT